LLVQRVQSLRAMRSQTESPVVYRHERAGWSLYAPGWWRRGDEAIFRRHTGVWFWYPDGLGGRRAIGPFMTMSAARRRAVSR
jgi:hypothetical protein